MEEPALANEPSSPDMPPMPPGLQGDNVDSSSGDENAEALGLDDPSLLEVPDLPDDPDGEEIIGFIHFKNLLVHIYFDKVLNNC